MKMFLYELQSVFCICLCADKGSLTFLTSLDVVNMCTGAQCVGVCAGMLQPYITDRNIGKKF